MSVMKGTNISSKELDQETSDKLKGDAIGDTLYSQSFVLKTLLQFSDLKWNEKVEEDLCFLWDMTVEPEVCKYLFEISFPSIACSAVAKYEENRFIEIVVGILANILCVDCDKNVTEDEIHVILNELSTDDSLILIQVVRFLSAIAFTHDTLPFVTKNVSEKLCFILSSSVNSELLIKTLEAASKLTQDFKMIPDLITKTLYEAALSAFGTVFSYEKDSFEIDTQEKRDTTKFILEIITNICAYINEFDLNELLLEVRRCNKLPTIISDIVGYYSLEENLFPISDELSFYMSAFTYVFPVIDIKYCNDLFSDLYKVLNLILGCNNKDEVQDVLKSVVELLSYQIYRGDRDMLCKSFKNFSTKCNVTIINCIKEYEGQFDFNVSDKLDFIVNRIK